MENHLRSGNLKYGLSRTLFEFTEKVGLVTYVLGGPITISNVNASSGTSASFSYLSNLATDRGVLFH